MNISRIAQTYGSYQGSPVNPHPKGGKTELKRDSYSLSSEAKDYQAVRNALSSIPDVREEKVNSIKGKIESGNYFVDAKDIAEKIFSQVDLFA